LAEGTRWLDPALHEASVATVFVGSTVAMGVTFRGQIMGRGDEGATEFGHMNHAPNGALCRCGMRGCIEAYAADYAILRNAYSVPETAPPAPAVPAQQYEMLAQRAETGDRSATHAFHLAGRAIGFGLSRMLAIYDPSHILIVGPGARALELMRPEIDQAILSSLVGRINGSPQTLNDIDLVDFAALPSSERAGLES
jgi:predicted NBD/HSP70 family sugar kinase